MTLCSVVVLALVGVLSLRAWRADADAGPSSAAPDALATTLDRVLQRGGAAGEPSVAIRPLAAASASSDDAGLADAVCAALTERLTHLPSLRVVPCGATAAAAAAQRDDRGLARLLAVRWVLSGRVDALPGERLRVQLALREVAPAREAWRIDEQMPSTELQALPSRVAEATGRALGQLDAGAPERLIAPEHYAKFVLARQLANRVSAEDRLRAIELLDEVIAAEPDHAASLYIRQNLRGNMLGNMPGRRETVAELDAARARNVAEGLELARRLSAVDPLDFRGQVLLLAHELEIKQWPQAFERMDRILQRHPRVPGLMRLAARLQLHAGYLRRARELARGAAQMNALDAEAVEILAAVAGIEHRDAEFRELLALAKQIGHRKLGPLQVFDAYRRAEWGDLERDYTAYVSWGGKWGSDWVATYVRGLADPARREDALRLLDGHDAATRQHFASYQVEYALLGDVQRSLRSVQHHSGMAPASWMQYLWWPELAPVRRHAGFAAAMRELGAVALWEARGAPELCSRDSGGQWACR